MVYTADGPGGQQGAIGHLNTGTYGQTIVGGVSFQPAFDSRMLNFPLLRAGGYLPGVLPRGVIYGDPTDPINQTNGGPYGVNFLYNPTTLDMSYALDTTQLPTNAQPLYGNDIPSFVPGGVTLTFGLLFDRTYECWTTDDHPGVLSDVRQFEKMVGYSAESPFIQPGSLYVVFGNQGLQFYGFMSSFDVTYTNWTQDMRPNRCAISGITMTVLPRNKPAAGIVSTDPNYKPPTSSSKPPTSGKKMDPTGRYVGSADTGPAAPGI